ncbi:LacI family transcriptional regulator [Tamaricihabitans halophyticus]|uniref:LacI family transcriptional regulator n=1 Tax=Tamaricihabitans halophyticus TaxID=1262583 RepID=A0A4R2QH77_9PSEU|nr:LacI family DNA-binding transcriptional regulator [Tamaricihabitans halophyticus]TCP48610.1 LacI family transcriptional regulator [Tamaricihabitans halophyticus]
MTDVARLAGVSVKTVSRVVNDEPGVHPDTASQVLAAIDSLGFRRHIGASNLRRGRSTGTVGLVLEDVSNPFYSGLTRAVEEVARSHGCQVLTGSSDADPTREHQLAAEFCARRVDGLIVVPTGDQHGYLAPEQHAGTPIVCADRPPRGLTADTVLVDNVGGARAAVAHLAAHGHRRIAFLGDSSHIFTAGERLRGFREGCALAGIELPEHLIQMAAPTEASIGDALRAVLDGPSPATALFTGNNRATVHALRALHERDHRPALVGFDDFELADLLRPAVTVIAHDPAELGRAAAERLFARMRGDSTPAKQVVLPVRLVPRGSGEVST